MSAQPSGSLFGRIKAELEAFVNARVHLLQLEATEKMAKLIGVMSVVILAGVLVLLVMLCTSLMAGYYFAQVFDSYFYGFALVAGFYLLLLIILLAVGRKKLATFIADRFVEAFFNSTADNEDD